MLQVILNRLKAKAAELLAKEQAGFWPGRSTVEQIFNCQIIIEKSLTDFKKAFDRVWHEGLLQVHRNFNIEEGLVETI